jgi:hypothetical protein
LPPLEASPLVDPLPTVSPSPLPPSPLSGDPPPSWLLLPAEAPLPLPEAPDDGAGCPPGGVDPPDDDAGWSPPGGVEPPDELPADVPLLFGDEAPAGPESLDPLPGAAPDSGALALLLHAIGPSAIAKTIPMFNGPYRMGSSCRGAAR